MTPLRPSNHKLTLLLLVCTGVLGGALLLSHARHAPSASQNVEPVPTDQHNELPPVW
jgi:hypothetical protein